MTPRAGDRTLALALFVAVAVLGLLAWLVWAPLAAPVAVGAATGLLVILYRRWKDDTGTRLRNAVREIAAQIDDLRGEIRNNRSEIEETRALVALQEPRFTLPLPWTAWAIPPRGLLEILKAVQEFDAPTIIDCGSGVSTVHLARTVRELGRGRVIALEQDADWAAFVQRVLDRNELQRWARIVVAPLKEATFCGHSTRWYATPTDLLGASECVDVVVADGPTGEDGTLTRIGALPHFWDRLSERGVVFLDDTTRPDEQEICRAWREHYRVTETSVGTEHGMSKFTRRR